MRVQGPSMSRASRRRVLTWGLLTGLMASGYGVMFTVLDDFRDEYGIGEFALGMIVAAGFFASFLTQVLIAPLADRGHARRLVYAGLLFNVVGLIGMAFGQSIGPLLASRFVMGFGVGMAYPAIRRIVILADPDHLGTNLGMLLSADVAGFATGPAVSALLVEPLGLSAPFLVIAALTMACLPIVGRVRVVESVAAADEQRFAFDLLRHRPYAAAVALGAGVFIMIGTFDSLWSVVMDDIDASDLVANLGISLFAVPLILFGSIGGRLAQRVGPYRLATVGLLAGAVFIVLYGVLPSALVMLAVGVLHALNDGFTVSGSSVAAGMVVPADRQAAAQGMLGGIETLVAGLTALMAGALYQWLGRFVAFGAAAVVMVVLVGVARRLVGPAWTLRGDDHPAPADTSPSVSL